MSSESKTNRLEAFCDGVFAIAITLLILEIKIPPASSVHSSKEFWDAILSDWPSWFGFTLSFIIILIAWKGHHDMFSHVNKLSPPFVFYNGFLLFTTVIFPFSTGLMSEYFMSEYAQGPITIYCSSIFFHALAWFFVNRSLFHPKLLAKDEASARILETIVVRNNKIGVIYYLALTILSFWVPYISMILMTGSWGYWVIISMRLGAPKEE